MSSRIARSADTGRISRANAAALAAKGKGKAAVMAKRNSLNTPSPSRRAGATGASAAAGRQYPTRRNPGTARSPIFLDGEKTDEDDDDDDIDNDNQADEDYLYNARVSQPERPTRTRNAAPAPTPRSAAQASTSSSKAATASTSAAAASTSKKPAQPKKKEERKASVRKASYELDGTESELSDVPDEDEEQEQSANGSEDDDDEDSTSVVNLDDSESDGEMASRLLEAGDGESLLGSAAASSAGETDQEEERFIIEDTERREGKRNTRGRSSRTSTPVASSSVRAQDEGSPHSDRSGSLSPHTLRQLGLDGLFDPADAYGSSSEPSFTDFFGSDSDEGMENEIEVHLEARSDDDELTTDDDSDDDGNMSEISDLEGGLLSVPFVPGGNDALAAGAGTQLAPGAEMTLHNDIPLLVIEDLDGRLIYARAQDGEAVFGSDGEFECVDDSDAEDTDDDEEMGGIWQRGQPWPRWHAQGMDDDETDSGDTTDELPNEDMPFPRLLVGSVAPHGGRSARRARALAARHRKLSPSGPRGRSPASSVPAAPSGGEEGAAGSSSSQQVQVASKDGKLTAPNMEDVDFTISVEDLARDPQGTLEKAAKSLGISAEEVANMVAGIDDPTSASTSNSPSKAQANNASPQKGLAARTPPKSRPLMGSFMPTSSKSVHRAVIDGSRQAPSPFVHRHGTQKRGLAARKRQTHLATPSSKRLRRASNEDAASSQHAGSVTDLASESGASVSDARGQTPSPPGENDDEDDIIMDLDDVMDASLLWRGSLSSSPPKDGEVTPKGTSPTFDAQRQVSSGKTDGKDPAGLNMSAVARWHRIPMAAFREGQLSSASSSNRSLGAYLFARPRQGNGGRFSSQRNDGHHAEHSPFRGRGQGTEVHLGAMPTTTPSHDAFIVSPVLWPVRGRNEEQTHAAASTALRAPRNVNTPARPAAPGKGKSVAPGKAKAEAGEKTRKTMTRRQKRERKARRDIISAALQESGFGIDAATSSATVSPTDERATNGLDSPSGGMPRLSITDSTPLASPALDGPQLGESSTSAQQQQQQAGVKKSVPMDIPTSSRASKMPSFLSSSPALMGLSSSPVSIPTHAHASATSSATQHGGALASSIPMSMSPSSSAASSNSYQQPPSSVFGMPLHSPLFSGLMNPPNLGFRDDLDEREEEGVLTI